MRIARLGILLFCVALSARAALVPGPERTLAPATFGELPGFQHPVALASDGSRFLVLWRDDTDGRDGLYAVMLDENGVRRTTTPVLLTRATMSWSPKAVWTGDAYLVAWSENGVRGALVDRDGAVTTGPFTITTAMSYISGLAWDGSRALLGAFDNAGSLLLTLNANGSVIGQRPIPDNWVQGIVAADDAFVAVLVDQSEPQFRLFRAIRVSAELDVSAGKTIFETSDAFAYSFTAGDGNDVGVAIVGAGTALRYTLDAHTLEITPHGEFSGFPTGVIATADGFATTYIHMRTSGDYARVIAVTPFDSAATREIVIGDNWGSELLAVTSSHGAILGVWTEPYAVTKAATFNRAFTQRTGEIRAISGGVRPQTDPAIATYGDVSLAAWSSCDELLQCAVSAVRLDHDGTTIDAAPIVVGQTEAVSSPIAIVFTGELWLVAWQSGPDQYGHVFLRRISANGEPLDAAAIDLGPGAEPDFASNGSVTAMVMAGPPHGQQRNGIFVLRFSPRGEALTPAQVPLTDRHARKPAIATNGDAFLAVWGREMDVPFDPDDQVGLPGIFGLRLDANGFPIETAPIAIAIDSTQETTPDVASDGTNYLVVYDRHDWTIQVDPPLENPPPDPTHFIAAKRVLATGILADTTSTQTGSILGEGGWPTLVAAGGRYGLFFRRFPNDVHKPTMISLLGMTVDVDGAPLGLPHLLARGESYFANYGAAAFGDSFRIAYARVSNDPVFARNHRAFFRTVFEDETRRRPSR